MLLTLSIRDVVIVERLTIGFHPGLNVLTGETGAGKSILLDALGLALGGRADSALIRAGAPQAGVSAVFEIGDQKAVRDLAADHGIDVDDTLVLRRTLSVDGRSRAFLNDEPVSVGFLREIGALLVEIQVQSESHALLSAANHRRLLDLFGGFQRPLERLAGLHASWQTAAAALAETETELARVRAEEDFLRHAVKELSGLAPRVGEEEELNDRRTVLKHGEKLGEALAAARAELADDTSVSDRIRVAARILTRVSADAAGALDRAVDALQRAAIEVDEAAETVEQAAADLNLSSGSLEELEDRLFALRAVARKHGCEIGGLAALLGDLESQLDAIQSGDARLAQFRKLADEAQQAYAAEAEALSQKRAKAARALEKAIAKELAPLKLAEASFKVVLRARQPADWSKDGKDDVAFEAVTNKGQAFAPLAKIASGGELSRFMLALQVVLAGQDRIPTMVFDEADSGIGGATAAAVGDRLRALADDHQVLVVTHSPQVAARGQHHWRIAKGPGGNGSAMTTVAVEELQPDPRREEIARMLSGEEVTEEARAQADRLIEQGGS
ncbi:MAG: DNA repair protein RecN [Proteobacteria bacterium]|nr:DNA repair protein RecN [Pseudomonadota bacterium]MDA1057636.1 DNA repair protein RecN [Pseudomonadota bacterium]